MIPELRTVVRRVVHIDRDDLARLLMDLTAGADGMTWDGPIGADDGSRDIVRDAYRDLADEVTAWFTVRPAIGQAQMPAPITPIPDPLDGHPRADAIRVVARHVLAGCSEDDAVPYREDYPAISDTDWSAVVAEVNRRAHPVRPHEFEAAYQQLADAVEEPRP